LSGTRKTIYSLPTYLKDNVIIKHVFDTVHHIFCLRLSQFYWFWRGPEQWTKL